MHLYIRCVHVYIYVYVYPFRCCVAGMAYPTGNVPQNMIPLAKTSVSTIICSSVIVISGIDLFGYMC